jgi:hypothetical protein
MDPEEAYQQLVGAVDKFGLGGCHCSTLWASCLYTVLIDLTIRRRLCRPVPDPHAELWARWPKAPLAGSGET